MPVKTQVASTCSSRAITDAAMPQIEKMSAHLPPGYSFVVVGEYKEQNSGFADLAVALSVSVLAICLALMLQEQVAACKP